MIRGVFVGGLVLALFLVWKTKVPADTTDLAAVGRLLFSTFVVIQLLAVMAIVPGMTASLVAVEKERNTLSLLLISGLKPWNIILDKLLSRLLLLILYLAAVLPIFVCLLLFRGFQPIDIAHAYCVILATILFCAAIGIVSSVVMNRLHSALVVAYLVLLSLLGVMLGRISANSLPVLSGLLPPSALFAIWQPELLFGKTSVANQSSLTVLALGGAAGYSLLAFFFGVLALRFFSTERKLNLLAKLNRWLDNLFSGDDLLGKKLIRDAELKKNPIYWREAHRRFFTSNIVLIRSAYLLGIVLAVSSWISFFRAERSFFHHDLAPWFIGFYLMLTYISVVFAAAGAFSRERENKTLEPLCTTSIPTRDILLGKVLAIAKQLVVVGLLPPVIVIGSFYGIAGRAPGSPVLLSLLLVVMLIVKGISYGIRISLRHRRTVGAILHLAIGLAIQWGLVLVPLWIFWAKIPRMWLVYASLGILVLAAVEFAYLALRFEQEAFREFKG